MGRQNRTNGIFWKKKIVEWNRRMSRVYQYSPKFSLISKYVYRHAYPNARSSGSTRRVVARKLHQSRFPIEKGSDSSAPHPVTSLKQQQSVHLSKNKLVFL